MKNLVIAAMLVAFASSSAFAAAADTFVLKAKNGDVTFNHKVHADKLKDCKLCHGTATPGKVELDKEKAHALCKECHVAKKMGPTKCAECHKKA